MVPCVPYGTTEWSVVTLRCRDSYDFMSLVLFVILMVCFVLIPSLLVLFICGLLLISDRECWLMRFLGGRKTILDENNRRERVKRFQSDVEAFDIEDGITTGDDDLLSPDRKCWVDDWQSKKPRFKVPKETNKLLLTILGEENNKYNGCSDCNPLSPKIADKTKSKRLYSSSLTDIIVVPPNMIKGLCDHEVSLGRFIASPTKSPMQQFLLNKDMSDSATIDTSNITYDY